MSVDLMNFRDFSENMILAVPQKKAVKDLEGIGYRKVGSAELSKEDFNEAPWHRFVYEGNGRYIGGCYKLPLVRLGFESLDETRGQIGQNLSSRMHEIVNILPLELEIDFSGVFPDSYSSDFCDFNSFTYDKTPAGDFIRALASRRVLNGDLVLARQKNKGRKPEGKHAFLVPEEQGVKYRKEKPTYLPQFYCSNGATDRFMDTQTGFGRGNEPITNKKVGSLCLQEREVSNIVLLKDSMVYKVLKEGKALSRVRF